MQCTLALLSCAAFLASMSACDMIESFTNGKGDPDVEPGRFSLILDGAVTDTVEGAAVFGTTIVKDTSGAEKPLFVLSLAPDSSDLKAETSPWFSSQIMRLSEQPARGDFAFATLEPQTRRSEFPTEHFVFNFQMEDTTKTVAVTSDAGTLTITSSVSTRIAGRFAVEASGLIYNGTTDQLQDSSVTVEGKFNALGGEVSAQQF